MGARPGEVAEKKLQLDSLRASSPFGGSTRSHSHVKAAATHLTEHCPVGADTLLEMGT